MVQPIQKSSLVFIGDFVVNDNILRKINSAIVEQFIQKQSVTIEFVGWDKKEVKEAARIMALSQWNVEVIEKSETHFIMNLT